MGGRTGELILILVVFVLLFGAQRLPEIGAAIGKAIREFKKSLRDVDEQVKKPIDEQPK